MSGWCRCWIASSALWAYIASRFGCAQRTSDWWVDRWRVMEERLRWRKKRLNRDWRGTENIASSLIICHRAAALEPQITDFGLSARVLDLGKFDCFSIDHLLFIDFVIENRRSSTSWILSWTGMCSFCLKFHFCLLSTHTSYKVQTYGTWIVGQQSVQCW